MKIRDFNDLLDELSEQYAELPFPLIETLTQPPIGHILASWGESEGRLDVSLHWDRNEIRGRITVYSPTPIKILI